MVNQISLTYDSVGISCRVDCSSRSSSGHSGFTFVEAADYATDTTDYKDQ